MEQREPFAARVTLQWRSAAQRLSSLLLALIAVSLIVVGKVDVALVDGLRTRVTDAVTPLLTMVQRPIGTIRDTAADTRHLFDIAAENVRLREENARLKEWEGTAYQLEAQNQILKSMINVSPAAPAILKTEPIVAQPGGIYVRSVLIGGGARDGLAKGQATMVGPGLIGRITEVGAWSARVLLITDLNSRIPVIFENTRTHAILAGDNTPNPYLLYLPKTALVNVGDRVVTAGHDGMFPTGLAVGKVAGNENGQIRIAPLADLERLEYVQVIDSAASSALTPESDPASQW